MKRSTRKSHRAEERWQNDARAARVRRWRQERGTSDSQPCRSTADCPDDFANALLRSAQRLRPKLHGQGPRAEADAARRLRCMYEATAIQRAAKRRAIRDAGGVPPAH